MKDHGFTFGENAWHRAINEHAAKEGHNKTGFMYDAKKAALALEVMVFRLEQERMGTLPKTFKRCGCAGCGAKAVPVENYVTCALGVRVSTCPHMLAIERADMDAPLRDRAKAWTCLTHILRSGGWIEDFYVTVDDVMYWDSVMSSLCSGSRRCTESERREIPPSAEAQQAEKKETEGQ